MGVGDWAKPLLENNPYLDEIISCNAPWHNKQNCRYPANSPKTFLQGLFYVLFSREARYISRKKFTQGIDVLGSQVLGYYEEQIFPTDMESKAMQGVIIGVTIAYPSKKTKRWQKLPLDFFRFLARMR